MQSALKELYRILKHDGNLVIGVYRKWSYPAILRKLYDADRMSFLTKIIRLITYSSIKLKLIIKKTIKEGDWEIQKRVRDLLDTPIVRYWSKNQYISLFRNYNFEMFNEETISSMKIFYLKKKDKLTR